MPCSNLCHAGLLQLGKSYYQSVLVAYKGVMQTHIVGLIITIILMVGFSLFILWPFVSACRSEGRRIADLLSQLPPDIDVEGLVRRALAGSQPNTASTTASNTGTIVGKRATSNFSLKNEDMSAPQPNESSFFRSSNKGARKGSVVIV